MAKDRGPPVEILVLSSDDENEEGGDGGAQMARGSASTKRARSSSSVEVMEAPKLRPPVLPLPSRSVMEQERLARLASHQGGSVASGSRAAIRTTTTTPKFMSFGQLPHAEEQDSSSSLSSTNRSARNSSANGQRFWKGELKRTPNRYHPQSLATSLSFSDVVGPSGELTRGIVISMDMDSDFVISHFPPNVPLLFISKNGADPELPNVTARFPPSPETKMYYEGVFHVKAFILYYKSFVRICVTTANAVRFDWDLLENAMFIQDFPLSSTSTATHTEFSHSVAEVLSALRVPPAFLADFDSYDYSASRNSVKLVTTHQGAFEGWKDIERGGGLTSLAKGVAALSLSPAGRYELEVHGSSLGKMQTGWLAQMLGAASSMNPRSYFAKSGAVPPLISPLDLPIKIVFPTLACVDGSRAGRPGGGTIFCREATWTGYSAQIKLFFRRAISQRPGVMSHAKFILGLNKPGEYTDLSTFKYDGFVYVGSHNFTPSAWGTLSWSRGGTPKLTNLNYEMGVVIPIRAESEEEQERLASNLLAYARPLQLYSAGDVPWMQDVHLKPAQH